MTFEEEQRLRAQDRGLAMLDMPLPEHVPDRPAGLPPADEPIPAASPPPPLPIRPAAAPAPPAPTPATVAPGAPPAPAAPSQPTRTTDTESITTTTGRTKISKEERAAQDALQQTRQQQEGVVRQAGELAGQQADLEAERAAKKQAVIEQHGQRVTELTKAADAELAKRQTDYDQAQAAYKTATPRDFWTYTDEGNKRTADDAGRRKFWAGIAMALGGFTASSTGGRNTAYDMISDAVNRRDKLEASRIAKLRDVAQEAKEGISIARTKKADALADLAAWKASALDIAANEIEVRLAKLGRPAAEVKTNADVLKLRADAEQERAKFLEATRVDIKSTVVKKTQEIVGGGAGGAGSKVTGADIENVARLDADIATIDRLIANIGKKPVAWLEYRTNSEKWQRAEAMKSGVPGAVRQLGQATGLMNIAPEQGLRSTSAKQIHGDMTRVQNSIAKGYGGVITDSDRGSAASETAAMAATAKEMLANLNRARNTLKEKRDLYMRNKAISDPSGGPPVQAPAQPAPASSGGRRIKLKDGTIGMLYQDGSFEAESPVAAAR